MEEQSSSGVVIADPSTAVPIGGNVYFEPLLVRSDEAATGLKLVKNWAAFEGALLAIIVREGDTATSLGSAVVVAPGVAITARHVVDGIADGLVSGSIGMLCAGVATEGLELWRVHKVTMLHRADLAILAMVRASNLPSRPLKLAPITTRLPRVGERLLVSGFRSERGAQRTVEGRWTFEGAVLVTHGPVAQRHIHGRDSVMLPSSCLELDSNALGGMSGGPVFDLSGHVVGILSSSVSTEDGGGPSFVSLLWPALVEQFEGGWPPGLISGATCLLELDRRLRFIDNDACIQRTTDPEGKPAWFYEWWE